MNLETRLPQILWESIRSNYEKRNFTGAILDSFYCLSEILRNKSGIEGDGSALIGSALGGAVPKIKLNRLQTDSEVSIQKGMEQMLRGLYQNIRNPRSHDKLSDSEEDTQAIILFIGYVIKKIDQAKSQFSKSDFIQRVLDPDFVPQERYAELIVEDIPPRARIDVFLELYRENENWKAANMRFFLNAFFAKLNEEELDQIHDVVTENLKTSDAESTIRAVLGAFPISSWKKIGEIARLRIENKLIRSVRDGRYDARSNQCKSGSLGTWSTHIFSEMTLKKEMISAINGKLWSSSPTERSYIYKYLFYSMNKLSETMPESTAAALIHNLSKGDTDTKTELDFFPPWEESTWPEKLKNVYSSFEPTDISDMEDDIPF